MRCGTMVTLATMVLALGILPLCAADVPEAVPATTAAAPVQAAAPKAVPAEWTGLIVVPAINAEVDVLAMLTTRAKGHKTQTIALKLEPTADPTVAAQIKDLVIKGATVRIRGEMSRADNAILVKSITEIVPSRDPDHRKDYEKTVTRKH